MGQAASCLGPHNSHPHGQSQKSIEQEEVVKKVKNTLRPRYRAAKARRSFSKSKKGFATVCGSAMLYTA